MGSPILVRCHLYIESGPRASVATMLHTHPCVPRSVFMGYTYWWLNKMANILQTTFSNTFSWKKICAIWFQPLPNFVPKNSITNISSLFFVKTWCHTGDCLNQWWLYSTMSFGITRPQSVILRDVGENRLVYLLQQISIPLTATRNECKILDMYINSQYSLQLPFQQSGTKPNLVTKILATKFGFVPNCSRGGFYSIIICVLPYLCTIYSLHLCWIKHHLSLESEGLILSSVASRHCWSNW